MHAEPSSELPGRARDGEHPRRRRALPGWHVDVAKLARFGMVSVITTLIDFGIFNLLVIRELLPPVAATTISYTCGILASFVLNKWFTFRGGRDNLAHEFGLFVGINVIGLALNNGAVALAEHVAGGGTLLLNLAKLGAGALTWVMKFLTFKHWVFPVRELQRPPLEEE
jgi:putative flippase GtrA